MFLKGDFSKSLTSIKRFLEYVKFKYLGNSDF